MSAKISITCDVGGEHLTFLEEHVRAATKVLRAPADKGPAAAHAPPPAVSVAVVDAATMASLHERYLGKPGPTDVLSFELDHDDAGRVSEGEIVVCLDVAQQQAEERGHSVEKELLLYILHGLLHLCGHDDREPAAYSRMHAVEDEILTAIGIGPVFAAEGAEP